MASLKKVEFKQFRNVISKFHFLLLYASLYNKQRRTRFHLQMTSSEKERSRYSVEQRVYFETRRGHVLTMNQ